MSYNLDEGMGICMYHVGVKDNSCHSLMEYESVTESMRILECIAWSMNAVVMQWTMFQKEIVIDDMGSLLQPEKGEKL